MGKNMRICLYRLHTTTIIYVFLEPKPANKQQNICSSFSYKENYFIILLSFNNNHHHSANVSETVLNNTYNDKRYTSLRSCRPILQCAQYTR